jgi:pimeloyl-ACP methyl ester carboxylesterase
VVPAGIVFAHANGYPAGTYRVLFDAWRAAGHAVHAIERIGHDPQYPVNSNMPKLRDELAGFVEAQAPTPVWLVGHSLGGLLGLLVACRRPELVRGLVMLDAPLFSGWRAHSLQVMKATGLVKRVFPGKVSSRRRHMWPTREAVAAHFAAKAAFARWDERVLADYVRSGFDEHAGQVVLGFQREIETHIYNALPHHLDRVVAMHPPRCPVAYVAARQSVIVRQAGLGLARVLARERFEWIEGNHLYPMEQPDATAATVLRILHNMAP